MAHIDFTSNKLTKVSLGGTPMAFSKMNETGQPEYRVAQDTDDMIGSLYGAAANDTVVRDLVDLEGEISPTIAEAKAILPLFFPTAGSAAVGGFWDGYTDNALPSDPADTAAANRVQVVKETPDGDYAQWSDCWFTKLEAKAEQGGAFDMMVGLLGKTRSTGSSVTAPTAGNKSRFGDTTIEIGGSTLAFNSLEVALEWVNETDSNNNLTRDSIGVSHFAATITLGANVNATTRAAFYDILNTETTAAVNFKVENGGAGWGLHFGAVYWTGPDQQPQDGAYWKAPLVGQIRGSDVLAYTL